jgi:D-alanyl-D-alanine-carboxypeptidase/D-alanyl-D-alanine-endopeptidase
MTVMRAWALLFWPGVLIGFLHTILTLTGADPPAGLGYAGPLLLAASAVPVLVGVGHRLIVGRGGGADRAADSRLEPIADLVSGRVRGAVGVLVDGERRIEGTWGVSGTDRPLYNGTRLEIGSVSKTFTATLLADMVVRGEVSLDDRAAEYVPGVPPSRAGEDVTLLDLATHSAGLPRVPREVILPAILQSPDPYRRFDERRLEAAVRRTRPRSRLGEMAKYSNFGVALLGHALAVAAGRRYADLIAERILAPLGLTDTAVATLDAADPRAARGHDAFAFEVPPWDLAAIAPAGGIVSTAADMERWLGAQLRPESTPLAEAIRIAHEPRLPLHVSALGRVLRARLQGSRVGLAWITTEVGGRRVVWHNGGTGGFGSFVGVDPEAGRGVVVLTNSTHTGRVDAAGLAAAASSAPR